VIVVAIYNLKGNEALLARELAGVLGKTVVETSSRVRAPGGGPSIIAGFPTASAAQTTVDLLHSRGFDTLLLGPAQIEDDQHRFVVRSFELEADAVRVEARDARSLTVPYADVELGLRGVEWVRQEARTPPPTRKLSLMRAALSGGLILTKPVQAARRPAIEERYGFVQLYSRALPPIAFRESEMTFRSLGKALLPSRQGNFALLAGELRQRCARALWDERLGTRAGQAQLLGASLAPSDHLDVALSVLAAALRPSAAT
jgi:hypothetical protein